MDFYIYLVNINYSSNISMMTTLELKNDVMRMIVDTNDNQALEQVRTFLKKMSNTHDKDAEEVDMAKAAKLLLADYQNDDELTAFTK